MKRFLTVCFITVVMTTGISGQTNGTQTQPKKQYSATEITVPPNINGILDEQFWSTGSWIDDFTQHEPYNDRKASQRTEFCVLFDKDNLYVGIKSFDTHPDSIVNRLTRRDQ
jgi:hypothetical protein